MNEGEYQNKTLIDTIQSRYCISVLTLFLCTVTLLLIVGAFQL